MFSADKGIQHSPNIQCDSYTVCQYIICIFQCAALDGKCSISCDDEVGCLCFSSSTLHDSVNVTPHNCFNSLFLI